MEKFFLWLSLSVIVRGCYKIVASGNWRESRALRVLPAIGIVILSYAMEAPPVGKYGAYLTAGAIIALNIISYIVSRIPLGRSENSRVLDKDKLQYVSVFMVITSGVCLFYILTYLGYKYIYLWVGLNVIYNIVILAIAFAYDSQYKKSLISEGLTGLLILTGFALVNHFVDIWEYIPHNESFRFYLFLFVFASAPHFVILLQDSAVKPRPPKEDIKPLG